MNVAGGVPRVCVCVCAMHLLTFRRHLPVTDCAPGRVENPNKKGTVCGPDTPVSGKMVLRLVGLWSILLLLLLLLVLRPDPAVGDDFPSLLSTNASMGKLNITPLLCFYSQSNCAGAVFTQPSHVGRNAVQLSRATKLSFPLQRSSSIVSISAPTTSGRSTRRRTSWRS